MKRQKIVWKIYCDICFLPFSRTDSLARHKTNRSCTKEAVSQPVLQKGIISEDQGNLLTANIFEGGPIHSGYLYYIDGYKK